MGATFWVFLKTVGKYNIWVSFDYLVYNVTETKAPPETTAGYSNLDSLLRLKGLA